ncbi:hypothetical protein G7K_5885-t1 [Saitoella complicata NRRL Y-17804]|uniref:Uncharacterized protein n=1 Tax=Saitoella complicata (strain BCRC 22490 / CBS 7301 / JCM 7358 / NBRC 10748 / NRRL Y-17804) TaxID=698492 RepID=A0A0E9NPM6_SAICN|nr:hypothetical protein G7K_5885-t1 [Saitoella complicata NRRL Y-17804]
MLNVVIIYRQNLTALTAAGKAVANNNEVSKQVTPFAMGNVFAKSLIYRPFVRERRRQPRSMGSRAAVVLILDLHLTVPGPPRLFQPSAKWITRGRQLGFNFQNVTLCVVLDIWRRRRFPFTFGGGSRMAMARPRTGVGISVGSRVLRWNEKLSMECLCLVRYTSPEPTLTTPRIERIHGQPELSPSNNSHIHEFSNRTPKMNPHTTSHAHHTQDDPIRVLDKGDQGFGAYHEWVGVLSEWEWGARERHVRRLGPWPDRRVIGGAAGWFASAVLCVIYGGDVESEPLRQRLLPEYVCTVHPATPDPPPIYGHLLHLHHIPLTTSNNIPSTSASCLELTKVIVAAAASSWHKLSRERAVLGCSAVQGPMTGAG